MGDVMLLHDHIVEHCVQNGRSRGGPDYLSMFECVTMNALIKSTVYDVTDCFHLGSDWDRESKKAVPRRPPADFCWGEWNCKESFAEGDTRHYRDVSWGCLVYSMPAQDALFFSKDEYAVHGDYQPERESYGCLGFYRLNVAKRNNQVVQQAHLGFVPGMDFVFMDNTGSNFTINHIPLVRSIGDMNDAYFFGLPFVDLYSTVDPEKLLMSWPMWYAFSLLHCKNIVTVDHPPDARILKHCKKQGLPPRVTYKTLRVEVPKTTKVYKDGDHASFSDDSPKVRQHICSGHFRELRSDRFKNKQGEWIWIPQHVRGSEELGQVITRRKLV